MGRLVPLVLAFLARLAGMGDIGQPIQALLRQLRRPLEAALEKLVALILRLGQGLLAGPAAKEVRTTASAKTAASTPPPAEAADARPAPEKEAAVRAAVGRAQPLVAPAMAAPQATATALLALLAEFRLRTFTLHYRGQGQVAIRATLNPSAEGYTTVAGLFQQLTLIHQTLTAVTSPHGNLSAAMRKRLDALQARYEQVQQQLLAAPDNSFRLLTAVEQVGQVEEHAQALLKDRTTQVNSFLQARYVKPIDYARKHWEGNTRKSRIENSVNNGPGQFLETLTAEDVQRMEQETLLNGDMLEDEGHHYHAYKRYVHPIGYANGELAYVLISAPILCIRIHAIHWPNFVQSIFLRWSRNGGQKKDVYFFCYGNQNQRGVARQTA
jgi:hypothetical protein